MGEVDANLSCVRPVSSSAPTIVESALRSITRKCVTADWPESETIRFAG